MDAYQSALAPSRLPLPLGPADKLAGAQVGRVSNEYLSSRPVGDPRRDVVVELGAGAGAGRFGSRGLQGSDGIKALEGLGLYKADGHVVRSADEAQPGSEAKLRSALEDLGLSPDEIEDFLQVSRMLARFSPEAAVRLEEGLRAMAETAAHGSGGDSPSPMDRLGGRDGYALDYMRLEFSYTQTSERVVHNSDGTVSREVSSTQVDLSFERLEVAFRGKADDAPAFLNIDGDDLSLGSSPATLVEALPETDVDAAGLRSLLDALDMFRASADQRRREEREDDEFGLKRLGEGVRHAADAAAAVDARAADAAAGADRTAGPGRRGVELLFA